MGLWPPRVPESHKKAPAETSTPNDEHPLLPLAVSLIIGGGGAISVAESLYFCRMGIPTLHPTPSTVDPTCESLHVNPTVPERRGAGVETQKNVLGEIGGWGRVPFNEPYAPSLSTIYDGA